MKKISIIISLIVLLVMVTSCKHSEAFSFFQDPQSSAITLLLDNTDQLQVKPSGKEIAALFEFHNDDIYNGYSLRMRKLSAINLSDVYEKVILPQNVWTGDHLRRTAEIRAFRSQITTVVDTLAKENSKDEQTSVLYRTITEELNKLSALKSTVKTCVIYSDLRENSEDGNYYSLSTLTKMKLNPDATIKHLEGVAALSDLSGVTIHVVYKPKSYKDELAFDIIMGMYHKMWERHHATVIVSTSPLSN